MKSKGFPSDEQRPFIEALIKAGKSDKELAKLYTSKRSVIAGIRKGLRSRGKPRLYSCENMEFLPYEPRE